MINKTNNKMNARSNSAHRKYNFSLLLVFVLIEFQLSSLGLAASLNGGDPLAHPDQTGPDSNSIQQTLSTTTNQLTGNLIAKTQTQESGAPLTEEPGIEVGPTNQQQQQLTNNRKEHALPTSTTTTTINGHQQATNHNNQHHQMNHKKKPLSLKAETLLKGLSNFMNPTQNAANYFVPPTSPTSNFHTMSWNSKTDGLQKAPNDEGDPNEATSSINKISHSLKENEQQMANSHQQSQQVTENSAQQSQPLSEPSTLVNLQASADGMVSAPTRMSRQGNYIFRWGR